MVTLGVTIVLVFSLVFWLHMLDTNPIVSIPNPVMPTQNARDYYVAAANEVIDSNKIASVNWQPDKRPPGRPAPGWRGNPPSQTNGDEHVYSPAQKAALVAENVGAIQTLHKGLTYPYQEIPLRSFSTLLPHYGKIGGLSRLLALEAQVKSTSGDWKGAIMADLDAIQVGQELPHGGGLIGMSVGETCQANGRRQAWDAVNHLNAAEARANARRLEQIRARHVPFAPALQESKWAVQAGLLELMRQKNWPSNLLQVEDSDPEDGGQSVPTVSRTLMGTWMRFTGKRTIMGNYARYMDQSIANAGQPYAAHLPSPPTPTDPFNQMALPGYDLNSLRLREVLADTENVLLLTALALRAYKLEHGAYPASLAALVPQYLKAVPADPFALSGSLRYKRQGAVFLLYSVGPDGKDNAGQAIFDQTKPAPTPSDLSDQRYHVQENSVGDIVAGVNRN